MLKPFLAALLALLAVQASSAQSIQTPAIARHSVFAHYMFCYAAYGDNIDAYKKDIEAAQSRGIDGFAPFSSGAQRFVLVRDKKTIIDKTGERPILASDASPRFNYFAGEAIGS